MNRILQRRILDKLSERYPGKCELSELPGFGRDEFQRELIYLKERKFIEGNSLAPMLDEGVQLLDAKITAYGLDVIENDGGEEAIRNAVYVEIEPEIIRALLGEIVDNQEDLPEEEKNRYRELIRSASAEQLKALLVRFLRWVPSRLPDAVRLVQLISDLFP